MIISNIPFNEKIMLFNFYTLKIIYYKFLLIMDNIKNLESN
jgi:hypothetical protein